jgi:hypothetical protein
MDLLTNSHKKEGTDELFVIGREEVGDEAWKGLGKEKRLKVEGLGSGWERKHREERGELQHAKAVKYSLGYYCLVS